MYLDIFRQWRWMNVCATTGAVFNSLFYAAMTVCVFIWATPHPHQTWLQQTSSEEAELLRKFAIPQSVVGLAIDLYILILPVIAVRNLQMATNRKFGVIVVFMTGIL